MSTDTQALQRLAELGQSVWIDYLSRELLEGGELARLMPEDAVVGVTSNPAIFEQAISHGDAYDAQLRELLPRRLGRKDLFLELACAESPPPATCCSPFGSGRDGQDGYVSIEVDPNLAHDTRPVRGGPAAARADRPPEPARQDPGDEARRGGDRRLDRGRTLDQRHAHLLDRALRRGRARLPGGTRPLPCRRRRLSRVHSVASFFVSRVDTETDRRLDALGAPAELKGKLGIANAKLAYARYREIFSAEDELWARAWRRRARTRSAACGPRPRPRTPPTGTCATSRS